MKRYFCIGKKIDVRFSTCQNPKKKQRMVIYERKPDTMKNKIRKIKNWFCSLFSSQPDLHYSESEQSGYVNIPIQAHEEKQHKIPVHFSLSGHKTDKINRHILNALGGLQNIESYREIPNSRRIRLTLINPNLVDNALLEEIDVRMFIRIGKRIVHIIP